jgi:hypothetical protein
MSKPKTWDEMTDHERIESLHFNIQELMNFVNGLSHQLKTRVDKLEAAQAENKGQPKKKR